MATREDENTLFQNGPNRTALGLATNLPTINYATRQSCWCLQVGHALKATRGIFPQASLERR
jgi:hypothetical protein